LSSACKEDVKTAEHQSWRDSAKSPKGMSLWKKQWSESWVNPRENRWSKGWACAPHVTGWRCLFLSQNCLWLNEHWTTHNCQTCCYSLMGSSPCLTTSGQIAARAVFLQIAS
jgi:hypothetical protein